MTSDDFTCRHHPRAGRARPGPAAAVSPCRRGAGARAAVARSAGAALPGHRAVASGLRQFAADRRRCGRRSTTSPISISISPPNWVSRTRCWSAPALGGWIAAEMMVRSTARFSRLVLVDPLGIKLRGRDERDIADMHAMPRAEYLRLAWADPAKGEIDFTALAGERAGGDRARPRGLRALRLEALHAQPAAQALAASDRPADPAAVGRRGPASSPRLMARAGARRFPGARLEVIPSAGHFPHWEQPEAFVRRARRPSSTASNGIARRSRCASGTSRRWPTTRPGRRG